MGKEIDTKEVLKTLIAILASGQEDITTSLIQRRMRKGYNWSASVLDELESGGAIIKSSQVSSGCVAHYSLAPEFKLCDCE